MPRRRLRETTARATVLVSRDRTTLSAVQISVVSARTGVSDSSTVRADTLREPVCTSQSVLARHGEIVGRSATVSSSSLLDKALSS